MYMQTGRITGKRILLVEDERVVREALRLFLLLDDHTVVEANNGAEALALFRSGQFDLVMTDFEMPFVKGNELATRIRQLAPRQQILMVTAYSHRPGPENPVNAIVRKPFDAGSLRETMGKLLTQSADNDTTILERCDLGSG